MKSRRFRRSALLSVLCTALLCSIGSCSSPAHDSSARTSTSDERLPHWVPAKTPAQVAQSMRVKIPAAAADLRAAYQRGFQSDTMLLAFTLPKSDMNAFIETLNLEVPLTHRDTPVNSGNGDTPTTPFAHLGLQEPDTLSDVTEGPVCTDCDGELEWLNIAVHPIDTERNQVYLSGAI